MHSYPKSEEFYRIRIPGEEQEQVNERYSIPGGTRKDTIMKLLLTSGGVTNGSIRNTLVDLLGKPISESNALYIPTALHANTNGPDLIVRLVRGEITTSMCALEWKSLRLLELTALPSIDEEHWRSLVQKTDALLVEGGDPLYLSYWMRQSGLANLLPSLHETVYVGLSAGSMVMAPRVGEDFVRWKPPTGGDETLGVIDFSIFPHLNHEDMPDNTMVTAEKWAAQLGTPAYVIDDQTAIKVIDGAVEVISEGHWKRLTP
jgi:dipeptidase E